MFSLTLWRMKQILKKESAPLSITKVVGKKKRYVAKIDENGTKMYYVHNLERATDGKESWHYCKYLLEKDGSSVLLSSGTYPVSFTAKRESK